MSSTDDRILYTVLTRCTTNLIIININNINYRNFFIDNIVEKSDTRFYGLSVKNGARTVTTRIQCAKPNAASRINIRKSRI